MKGKYILKKVIRSLQRCIQISRWLISKHKTFVKTRWITAIERDHSVSHKQCFFFFFFFTFRYFIILTWDWVHTYYKFHLLLVQFEINVSEWVSACVCVLFVVGYLYLCRSAFLAVVIFVLVIKVNVLSFVMCYTPRFCFCCYWCCCFSVYSASECVWCITAAAAAVVEQQQQKCMKQTQ